MHPSSSAIPDTAPDLEAQPAKGKMSLRRSIGNPWAVLRNSLGLGPEGARRSEARPRQRRKAVPFCIPGQDDFRSA
jgi:hypothetical protein